MPARKIFVCLCAGIFLTVSLFGQAQRLVLFEEFSSEDCPTCDSVNPYVHVLARQLPNKVIAISYQSYIPTPGPLYYQDVSDDQARMNYYGVNSAPWGQQDGALWDSSLVATTGNNPLSWCITGSNLVTDSAYPDTEYANPSPFTITVTHNFTTNTDSFYATVIVTGADSFMVSATGKLALRVAMTEDLQFEVPPGTNDETDFLNVVRHMYPNAAGTTLADSWISNQTQTFNFSGPVPLSIKDKTKVRFVAFIQDDNNLHVLQAGVSNLFTFTLDAAAQNIPQNFLQCSTDFIPAFTLRNKGSSAITNCSVLVDVDGVNASTQPWSGNLQPDDSVNVTLTQIQLTEGVQNITIAVQNPNNSIDGNPGNNSTATFQKGVTLSLPVSTPLIQGFETIAGDTNWIAESVSQIAYGWTRQNVGYNSDYSYRADFWDIPGGYVSNLYTPPFTLSGLTQATIKFDRAYAREDFGNTGSGFNEYSNDSLYIEVSTNCGETWQNVYANGSTGMATAPQDSLSPFTPVQTQWAHDSADLTIVAGNPNVILRFKAVSGNGNELYIDNVGIGYNVSGLKKLNNMPELELYPIPANNVLHVQLQDGNWANAGYRITDITGRIMMAGTANVNDTGQPGFTIGTSALANGIYLLTFTSGNENKCGLFSVIR